MILEYKNENNSHYYYVMAWKSSKLKNKPDMMEKFDIYDDAIRYFNSVIKKLNLDGYARMFEYIDGKRKIIATSDDGVLED